VGTQPLAGENLYSLRKTTYRYSAPVTSLLCLAGSMSFPEYLESSAPAWR
jgi:hypothetical protein